MELVRCLDTLTPSYFKSSDDGWLEKRSERIAHVSFSKREKWLAVVNKVGEWLGKRRAVQNPESERGDKSWDSPSFEKTMMPHTPSFWRQISFVFFLLLLLFFLFSFVLSHFYFISLPFTRLLHFTFSNFSYLLVFYITVFSPVSF